MSTDQKHVPVFRLNLSTLQTINQSINDVALPSFCYIISHSQVCIPPVFILHAGGHQSNNGQWRPLWLCRERGMGVSRHAGIEKSQDVRLLFWPLHRGDLHPAPQTSFLLLHLQLAAALLPHLIPGSSGLLPAGRLRGEGFPRGHGAVGAHRVPVVGGWEHASCRKHALHRLELLMKISFCHIIRL